ncbi:MAG: prolipoprotein diacylglyceryl transferase [Sandaracinaceae bacterium]|nr:prolipoprotein diacylglyceryl transferase [Sandaracinaceae bacterium]
MHPILFYIPTPWGSLPIFSYGVMLGTSLIIAWYLVMWLGTTCERLDREMMANCFIVTAVAAIAGARILYIVTNPGEFPDARSWLALRSGGLVAYGGFIGGFFGSLAYLRARKQALLPWADVVAPTLATGLLFTRIGCYLFGCDFGQRLLPSAPSWLRRWGTFPHWDFHASPTLACANMPNGAPAFNHHVQQYHLAESAHFSLPVHPTQLYESAAGLVLFGMTMFVWHKRKFRGQPLLVLVIGYSAWRFLIEFLRDDPERGGAFNYSTSQLISLALLPLGIFFYVVWNKRARDAGYPTVPNLSSPPPADLAPALTASAAPKPKPKQKKR